MLELPLPKFLASPDARSRVGWLLLRLALAGIIGAHGWARLLAGGVAPFGTFLNDQGFPGGPYLASAVTAVEIVGSAVLGLGRLVAPLALLFCAILTGGIVLIHGRVGWFVVGLGRNGVEFSVLLIAALIAVALQHVRPAHRASDSPERTP